MKLMAVQRIVFHIGTPSTFKCAQRTSTSHGGHATFVLRGVIAHQGEDMMSGHYVTMLVEGDAIWTVDDGQCPQAQAEVPELFQRGAVMIWASKAEPEPLGALNHPKRGPNLLVKELRSCIATSPSGTIRPKNGCCNRIFRQSCWWRRTSGASNRSRPKMLCPEADGRGLSA